MAEVRGLPADIYKHESRDCSNGGLSSTADGVTIVGIVQAHKTEVEPIFEEARVFTPTEQAPPVVIVHKRFSFGLGISAVPAVVGDDGSIELVRKDDHVGPMMGGCYVETCDARFAELLGERTSRPVALHDRYETREHYASYD